MKQMRVLLVILLLSLPWRPALSQSFPVNGDFTADGTPPAGWFLDANTARKGEMALRPPPPGGSGRVLVLSPNAANTPSDKPYGVGQLLPANVFRGRDVIVSAVLGGEGGARAVLGLAVLRRGGGAGATVMLRGDDAPMPREDRLTVPNDTSVEGLVLFLATEGTKGQASFANVSVRVDTATPVAPPPDRSPAAASGPYAPAPDIAASVRIDTTRIIRTIPRTVFGTNIEVIREANGLWDARNRRLDPQIVSLASELRLGPIRFPGGVWSDAYDWRNGIGAPEQRATTPTHPGADEKYRHDFGTDEALGLAQTLGTSLLITVNAATGTPKLAADWVRYVNGDGGRSPRGPRVDYWEVGNELYIEGDASGGHLSPDTYADKLLAFSAAMKAVDPAIHVGAIGLRNFGRYRLNRYDNWGEVVLRKAGAAMDFMAVHDAYAPVVGDDGGLQPSDVYAALWAAPKLIARDLADTWKDVERFAPAHASRIELAVTEWGPLFAITPASPWIDHVKTLGSAIFVAEVLKVFAEDPHVGLANFFKLNEASFMGWIGRSGSAWIPTAPFMAFRMVSRDMEAGLLSAATTVPGYDSKVVGFVDRVANVPYLDVLATASADRSVVTMLFINKSLNSHVVAHTTLSGAGGATRLVTQTLSGTAVDANTGTELPRIPGLKWGAQKPAGPAGRIASGGPNEVRLETSERANPPIDLDIKVPPHSLTLLRFEGLSRP